MWDTIWRTCASLSLNADCGEPVTYHQLSIRVFYQLNAGPSGEMINKVFVYLWNDVYHIYPDKAITRFYFHLVLVLHFNLFSQKRIRWTKRSLQKHRVNNLASIFQRLTWTFLYWWKKTDWFLICHAVKWLCILSLEFQNLILAFLCILEKLL